ncbi:MAG: mannose-6-phosphate isomerase, class I [Treponema sp. GWB1_62_6]|nr:MAG: mannose-6-phosphate isomerase, class I [Treponema sp. GWA1_62_8]OHE63948.1 MAG: mannose-6-phosphate isomerase, class I [Treponema sp. GWC1_61_84]OHE67241.1 MAG: mannose-6-phosphate isomerase, class I [Treponema sp. GWB1_62_6]HCM25271.1 mannose-6-phosphate isomerase, class I [Treponema sp.]
MRSFYKLRNSVRHYAWGSPSSIPEFLGLPNDSGDPWAELWMGAHPNDPSIALSEEGSVALDALIAENPVRALGEATASRFDSLPFLFKLLAAGRPLSIQAHPDKAQAARGFQRENEAGLPADAFDRNYKDSNHKPEILCALTQFDAMCGFRPPERIAALLDTFACPVLHAARGALETARESDALRTFQKELFSLSAADRRALSVFADRRAAELLARGGDDASCWNLIRAFVAEYPGDPAVVSPLYLNVLRLAPGQAIFLPAGILHAYVRGFGVELMANSDNVLRGGLTSKHVDLDELNATLRFEPFLPRLMGPLGDGEGLDTFPSDCEEFSLSVMEGNGQDIGLRTGVPSVIIVAEGTITLASASGETLALERGESAFISAATPSPRASGRGRAFVASVGAAHSGVAS